MVGTKHKPICLYYGGDEFIFEERVARIKNALILSNPEFNYNLFHAIDTPVETILETARTLPFLNPSRLVVVKGVEKLKSDEKETLVLYARNPQPTTCLVLFLVTEKEPKKEDKLYAGFKHFSERLIKPEGAELERRIQDEARARNKEITHEALAAIVDDLGNNLQEITSALDKLSTYTGIRSKITVEDVHKLISRITSEDVFKLIDAILRKDSLRAIKIFSDKLKEGKDPTEIIGTITWGMKNLLFIRFWLDQGLSCSQIYASLRVFGVFGNQDQLLRHARQANPETLRKNLNILFQTDLNLKTRSLMKVMSVELLLTKLCGQPLDLKV